MLTLFGSGGGTGDSPGMDEADRENVKTAFNDPASSVRILVATDAASEGLNLHRTARYLLHYDCPWNPSRLEQRNGRFDRYGQARDVTVHHFVSDADPDLRILDHVIRKADEIREDLGSVNEVFDRAVHRRLIQGEDEGSVATDLDLGIDVARGSAALESDTEAVAVVEEEARDAVLLDAFWSISCPPDSQWPATRRRFRWPWRSGCRTGGCDAGLCLHDGAITATGCKRAPFQQAKPLAALACAARHLNRVRLIWRESGASRSMPH